MHFSRHDRDYWIFSLQRSSLTFLYFSHHSQPIRALFFGHDIQKAIPRLLQNESTRIECGLGTEILGGVALDGSNCVALNCSKEHANTIIHYLQEKVPEKKEQMKFLDL
jgi:hypothetical protein